MCWLLSFSCGGLDGFCSVFPYLRSWSCIRYLDLDTMALLSLHWTTWTANKVNHDAFYNRFLIRWDSILEKPLIWEKQFKNLKLHHIEMSVGQIETTRWGHCVKRVCTYSLRLIHRCGICTKQAILTGVYKCHCCVDHHLNLQLQLHLHWQDSGISLLISLSNILPTLSTYSLK